MSTETQQPSTEALTSEVSAMDAETLEALHGSIRKWEKIVDGTGFNAGTSDCPLCALFWHDGCVDCPVSKRTGQSVCRGTPLKAYAEAKYRCEKTNEAIAAKEELAFLKSLLPGAENA